ncbi:MAG: glycosyltransferase family 39 protein [Dehalococcoidia bacterium]
MRALPLVLPLLVGVAIRLAWVLSGDFEAVSEAGFYHQHASEIVAGRGFVHPQTGEPSAFLPPGYPLLLAPFYWIFGPSTQVAGVLNGLLAGVAIAGTYVLARQCCGARAAVVAAWMLALFPSQVLYASAPHSDHLFAALVPWLLAAGLSRPRHQRLRRWAPVGTGTVIGVATLTAAIGVLLLPALAAAWAFSLPRREVFRRMALSAIAVALVLAPWAVRNYVQLETFVPVSTNGGPNLWIGNNEHAGHGWMPWAESDWTYPEDEPATDRALRDEALGYLAREPLDTLARWPGKLRHTFVQDYNYVEHFSLAPRVQEMPPGMNGSLLHWLADRYYFAVLLLAAGGALAASSRRGVAPLAPAALALALPTVLFFGLDRYHVPLLPIVVVPAAAALVTVAQVAMGQARVWQPVPGLARNQLRPPEARGVELIPQEGAANIRS